jgi:hypothetical protein
MLIARSEGLMKGFPCTACCCHKNCMLAVSHSGHTCTHALLGAFDPSDNCHGDIQWIDWHTCLLWGGLSSIMLFSDTQCRLDWLVDRGNNSCLLRKSFIYTQLYWVLYYLYVALGKLLELMWHLAGILISMLDECTWHACIAQPLSVDPCNYCQPIIMLIVSYTQAKNYHGMSCTLYMYIRMHMPSIYTCMYVCMWCIYSYSFYASRNILLVHELKERMKEQTVTAWERAIDNVTRSFSTVIYKTTGSPTHI